MLRNGSKIIWIDYVVEGVIFISFFQFWFGQNPKKCPNNFIRSSSHELRGIPRFPLVFSLPTTYGISV